MSSDLVKSDIKLTIGLLVSNHIQYIEKVMEGLRPLLENVSCELIVIDTKGADSDGSIEIVRKYTSNIYPFTWCNDFSAARNFCLEHARGEWFLYQDDDEWFDDVTEFIAFFNSGECEQYQSAGYCICNYDGSGGSSKSIAGRIIRRRHNTHFVGRVHEHFDAVYLPYKQFSCFTHHYGYAFQTLEDALRHQERNVSILKEELIRSGYTPHLCSQLTQELIYIETTAEEGLQFAQNALAVLKANGQIKELASQRMLYATVLYYVRKQDWTGAVKQILHIESSYPLAEITRLILYGLMSTLSLDTRNIENMLTYAQKYLELWDWRASNADAFDAQAAVFNNPYYYEENYYHKILHIGAAAANELHKFSIAKQFWDRMPWKEQNFNGLPYKEDLSITINGLKRQQEIQKLLANQLPHFDLLLQAEKELSRLCEQNQTATAMEYLETMQQVTDSLQAILYPLLGDMSKTIDLLKQYRQSMAAFASSCTSCNKPNEDFAGFAVQIQQTFLLEASVYFE